MDQTSQDIGNKLGHKLFFVGLNKTGTTSFHNFFTKNGYTSVHTGKWWSYTIPRQFRDYEVFTDGYEEYNYPGSFPSFPDIHKLILMFPSSKFIVQKRNIKSWLISRLEKVHKQQFHTIHDPEKKIYFRYLKHASINRLFWHRHLDYFLEKNKNFLEINLEDSENILLLENFLKVEFKFKKIPYENITDNKKSFIEEIVEEFLNYRLDEIEKFNSL